MRKKSCIVTFIDYTAAFDSISHKFMDATLAKAGASRKSRAIFRAIYAAATGAARVRSTDGEFIYSGTFRIGRGVIQGDIISPILFIIALDELIQEFDKESEGVKCGRILKLKVLGYADDAALIEENVAKMTERLTSIANASKAQADMDMNMAKTFTQHVHARKDIDVTQAEAAAAEAGFKFKCDFCPRRFKTQRHMLIHRSNCNHNYNTTDEVYEVEDIVGVFGSNTARWFKVKWKDYEEPEWEREHLLRRDGCGELIRDFWTRSNLQPNARYYPDPDGHHRCGTCGKKYKRAQDLKAHRTKTGHSDIDPIKITKTAVAAAKVKKRKAEQDLLPKVKWGSQEAANAWQSKYLGSIFEAGGSQMTDVRTRIAMAQTRYDKLRHIWHNNDIHLGLKLRLYKACICSILTYGSEAWTLTTEVTRAINGSNAQMMAGITGNTPHQEASTKSRTFDIILWIRARRLQWLGHILRMGTERLLKRAAYEMFKNRKAGDLLMDAPTHQTWKELCTYAVDRDYWRARVRSMKQPRIRVEGPEIMPSACNPFTIS